MSRRVTIRRSSRSRSPVLRGPRSVTTSSKNSAISMLDASSIEISTKSAEEPKPRLSAGGGGGGGRGFRAPERITCTISGDGRVPTRDRGGVHNRLSGGSFGSGGRGEMGEGNRRQRRSFEHGTLGGRVEKKTVRERLSNSNGGRFPRKESRRSDDFDDEKRNGSFREDKDKPVQRLIDPTFVPRSRAFFDHDDREAGMERRSYGGNRSYDPRYDFGNGRRNDRPRRSSDWDGFGRGRGDRNDRDRDRDRGSQYSQRSKADGVWTHDKFLEIEDEDEKGKKGDGSEEIEVHIDNRESGRRHVDHDD